LGGLDDVSGDGDVRLGGGGIARGVVVHHNSLLCPYNPLVSLIAGS
jgi:hypothetical protein